MENVELLGLCKGLLATARSLLAGQQSLGRTAYLHLEIMRILANEEGEPVDREKLRAVLAAAAAEVEELRRLHELGADASGEEEVG